MKVNLAVCTVIAISLILCPAAALGKSPPAVAETTVIQSAEDGSYISVMSASNGNVEKIKLREYVIGSVAAEMPAAALVTPPNSAPKGPYLFTASIAPMARV